MIYVGAPMPEQFRLLSTLRCISLSASLPFYFAERLWRSFIKGRSVVKLTIPAPSYLLHPLRSHAVVFAIVEVNIN
jgi:hypothetical protein